ncbi:MAG: DUF2269 family protein [Dehalococcoidia bacterium]
MTTEHVYLFLHITGAFLLMAATGATTGAGIALGRTTRAATAVVLLRMMRMSELIVRSIGALLVIVFGSLLVGPTGHSWGEAWISATLTLVVVSLAVDHGYLVRQLRGSLAIAERLGDAPISPELEARMKNPMTAIVGTVLDLLLFVILWLMIARPGAA